MHRTNEPESPLPWSVFDREVIALDDSHVADGGFSAVDDLDYIVTACNAYPELVAALKAITEDMDRGSRDSSGATECPWCYRDSIGTDHDADCKLLIARAALAKAEGQ
jgi:hypothetical protein